MKKALLVTALIGTLGLGGFALAGSEGGMDCGHRGSHHGEFGGRGNPEKMGEKLAEKLQLNDSQKAQLKTIMDDQKTKRDALRKQMMEQMKTLRDEGDSKITAILTPEQATSFNKMKEERQKRMEERRKKWEEGDAAQQSPAPAAPAQSAPAQN